MTSAKMGVKAWNIEWWNVEWPGIHSITESLFATYTMKISHRPTDTIHLATEKYLG